MDPKYAEISENCHIYLICRRPGFSYDPFSFVYEDGKIKGDLVYKAAGVPHKIPFEREFALYDGAVEVVLSPYPHREIHTLDQNGEMVRYLPATALGIGLGIHVAERSLGDLEVLYVGQAYAEGKRTAIDRLKSHSTLQKILATVQYNMPDDEIFVLTFEYAPYRIISMFDGMAKNPIKGEVDEKRFISIQNNPLTKHQQICLIEAGLIRYFQPEYNKIYKESFPASDQGILSACYELDFSALAVEINTDELDFSLYSKTVRAKQHHIAQFDLINPRERLSFFLLENENAGPVIRADVISPSR
ncbi:hypothetical protein [Cupriavidus taiwanensis]|nr:hypothetical protein [Cupriavidus taiwanensis]